MSRRRRPRRRGRPRFRRDLLTVYIDERHLTAPAAVLYDDGRILALDKPRGLPVDVDADGIGEDTLLCRARALHPGARLCHRLDAGTGARDASGADGRGVWRNHRAVPGPPDREDLSLPGEGTPASAGGNARPLPEKKTPPPPGWPNAPRARRGRCAPSFPTACWRAAAKPALVEASLGTGRTHQIRAQMALIGCPVLGDDKYGDRALNKRLGAAWPQLWCVRLRLPDGRAFESEAKF
jgi:hypothetical protein